MILIPFTIQLKPGFHGSVNYCTVSSAVKTGTAYCTANLFPWVACFARLFRGNDIMISLGVGLLLIVGHAEDKQV